MRKTNASPPWTFVHQSKVSLLQRLPTMWFRALLVSQAVVMAGAFRPLAPMPLTRRATLIGAGAAVAMPPRRCSAEQPLPPGAVVLRVAEVTSIMENQMKKSAAMTGQQRLDEGFDFARGDMKMSIDILLKNTKLATIPSSEESVGTLRGIQRM